jgi:hypothetical protein
MLDLAPADVAMHRFTSWKLDAADFAEAQRKIWSELERLDQGRWYGINVELRRQREGEALSLTFTTIEERST